MRYFLLFLTLFLPSILFAQWDKKGASTATIVGASGWTRSGTTVGLTTSGDKVQVIGSGSAAVPLLAIGNSTTGFFAIDQAAGRIGFAVNGFLKWYFRAEYIAGDAGTTPAMMNETASNTNPVFLPQGGDTDTGIGGNGADVFSLITGGTEIMNISSSGVKVTGTVQRNEQKALDAIAFFPPSTNGADLDTINVREEVYAFDSATAETLYVKWHIPVWFTSLDSVKLYVHANSSAGDSVAFSLGGLGIASGESVSGSIGNAVADTIDLGGTANVLNVMTLSGTFPTLAANDMSIWRLHRDVSITNDEAGDVRFSYLIFYFK